VETAANKESLEPTVPQPGNGRLILALIGGIPLIVILAASWLWYFVVNGELDIVGALGTANRGVLVQPPRQSLDAGWHGADGETYALPETPRWVLVVPQQGADCAADCEQRLFVTRQIHIALGKTMHRVARALVTDAAPGALSLTVAALSDERPIPDDFATYLERDQRGLTVWHSSPDSFAASFPEYLAARDNWYLMDPRGWIMMRYDGSVSYKDVISDLKFLLKNSNG
jgi:hypothetical protein